MTTLLVDSLISLDDITKDYEFLNEFETSLIKDKVKRHIENVRQRPNKEQWDSAWSELKICDSPEYFKPRLSIGDLGVYRYKQQYIKSGYANLENVFHDTILEKIQNTMLTNADCVVEFGCGTGHNLNKMKQRDSKLNVIGSDWTGSSQRILSTIGIPSWNFDMITCDAGVPEKIKEYKNVCFLTVGSLEQLGNKWKNFLDFMIDIKPAKSVHIEPIVEFYDPDNEIDHLAIEYHHKRNYLDGFFNHLVNTNNLESYQRISFGNSYNEGFSILELKYE